MVVFAQRNNHKGFAMHIGTLDTSGFVCFDYPRSLRSAVHDAMDSWKRFCELSDEQKLMLSKPNVDRTVDFGYMRRADKGPRDDNKEHFHAVLCKYSELLPRAERVGDRRATDFIHAVGDLLAESGPVVREFARAVEEHYSLCGFEQEVMVSQENWTFRYLHYFKGRPVLSYPHADRGGFTFHLQETHSGGEYFGFDGQWHPWPVSEERTIIFPSMGLQYRSQSYLKALWHRVISTEATRVEDRYSMVAFIDFKMGHRYNDRAKRLQDFDPGFNYDMSMAELERLFIPAESQTA